MCPSHELQNNGLQDGELSFQDVGRLRVVPSAMNLMLLEVIDLLGMCHGEGFALFFFWSMGKPTFLQRPRSWSVLLLAATWFPKGWVHGTLNRGSASHRRDRLNASRPMPRPHALGQWQLVGVPSPRL